MKSLNIPVQFCEYVLREKLSKPVRLYILLHFRCSGMIKIPRSSLEELAQTLGYKTERAVQNNLAILIDKGLMGYDKRSQYYFIRSFYKLGHLLQIHSRTSARFYETDINKFQSFCMGAVVSYVVSQQRKRLWLLGLKKASPLQSVSYAFFPVANVILVRKLNLCINTVYRLKEMAAKDGFIKVKKQLEPLRLKADELKAFMKANPDQRHLVRVVDDYLYIQKPDMICGMIQFCSGKKTKHLKSVYNQYRYYKMKGRI